VLPAAALAALLAAQNPGWPAADPDLSPLDLAQPGAMPDDPEYPPRLEGEDCVGQHGLYSFTPACTPQIVPEEQALGAGIGVDRAWLISPGRPGVTIALVGEGPDLADPQVAAHFILNPGEVPFPDLGVPTVRHDVNGDGAFTALDFTTATGTVPPTLDTVRDRRLRARPDQGDTNGNGLLDAQDILRIFADGRDDDANGYEDDIAGWDFLDDDNDPSAPAGAEEARRVVATANDGVGGAGACPGCTALALRVASRGLAGADRVAMALAYVAQRRAPVALVSPAILGGGPLLDQAVGFAFEAGTLVVASAGTGPSHLAPAAWPADTVLVVGAVGHDRAARTRATRQAAPDPCARTGPWLHVVAPGRCDDGAAALVAGVAGLVLSAAQGDGARRPALAPGLTPGELWSVLRSAATDLEAPGWDPATGWGRVDARAAVDAILRRRVPPHAVILGPAPGGVLDPSDGAPGALRLQLSRSRHDAVAWSVEVAPGEAPLPTEFEAVASGEVKAGDDARVDATFPLRSASRDPTSPRDTALTVQVRLRDEAPDGAATVLLRRIHVHRDLERFPAYPVTLPGGCEGGVRIATLLEGQASLLIPGTDGAIYALDARGAPREGFPVRGPRASWIAAHPRIPALLERSLDADAAAPLLAPLSVGPLGPEGGPLVVTVSADAQVLAFGPLGAVQAGFPVALRGDAVRAPEAPAGVTAAVAVAGDGAQGTLLVGDGHDLLWRLDPDGAARGPGWSLGAPPGAPALGEAGAVWVATPTALFHLDLATDTPVPGFPRALSGQTPRGLFAGPLPAPVLMGTSGGRRAVVAAWGGPITAFAPDGEPTALPALAWQTPLAAAAVSRGAAAELLASVAPEPQVRGLAPSAAPADVRVVLAVPGGQVRGVVGPAGVGSPAEPLVVDADGDERPDAIFADDEGRIWATAPDGRVARGFPKLTGDPVVGALAVGDLDGDGRLDLVAATRRGQVWAWRLATRANAPVGWSGARGGLRSAAAAEGGGEGGDQAPDDGGCACQGRPPAGGWGLTLAFLGGAVSTRRRRRAR
jgi:MYXO-CTERM domain-containing protein